MTVVHRSVSIASLCALALLASLTLALRTGAQEGAAAAANSIRGAMEFLASDALRGRGSATQDELVAATYIAAQLRQSGIEPAGADGGYLQRVAMERQELAAAPVLEIAGVRWTHGREMLVVAMAHPELAGPLEKIDAQRDGLPTALRPGAIVFLTPRTGAGAPSRNQQAQDLVRKGAVAVLLEASAQAKARWEEIGNQLPGLPIRFKEMPEQPKSSELTAVALSAEAATKLAQVPDGASVRLAAPVRQTILETTWNVLGRLRGTGAASSEEAVLLSAHLDHLGVGAAVKGDSIYNGADDDASGVVAVLELARALAAGPQPKRTVLFALFGSEERGGLGSAFFLEHPPVALETIVANLEFEMIGRPDPAVQPKTLWLTGYERSNLGAELAGHGARLVADPHPREHFFERSDNYVLAKMGVVAHTVSSYGLHKEYHHPSDDLSHIDFAHMKEAIASMVEPVRWLANSDFRPQWAEGKRP
ncbi:MAG: M20/M25/M40 family metallo-hydrolase [Terriglobales bacterium]